jgi:glycosyltransferase involved in cell wall biosynthesis
MSWPKITIVTPSFNHADYLESTIKSIHNQGYPNLEHIIIDGGSTDGSVEIIKKYEEKLTYWVSEPDHGQTDALIKGFSHSSGDILAWLNSDDLYLDNALFTVAKYFINNPKSEFVFGNCYWIDKKGNYFYERKEIPFIKWIWLYAYNYIPQPSSFWKKNLYEKVGGLDPKFLISMDGDLFARFSNVAEIYHINQTLACFRYYEVQRNRKFRKESLLEDEIILAREIGHKPSNIEKLGFSFAAKIFHRLSRNFVQ